MILVLIPYATGKKVRWAAWRDEKKYPHRPYADGGLSKGVEKSEVPLTPRINSCKPDAKKKNVPTD